MIVSHRSPLSPLTPESFLDEADAQSQVQFQTIDYALSFSFATHDLEPPDHRLLSTDHISSRQPDTTSKVEEIIPDTITLFRSLRREEPTVKMDINGHASVFGTDITCTQQSAQEPTRATQPSYKTVTLLFHLTTPETMPEVEAQVTQRRRRQPRWDPDIRRMNRRRRIRYRVQIHETNKKRRSKKLANKKPVDNDNKVFVSKK
ncbi:hypothetical protein ACRALDRAFT_206671 [Sodiomyces alcalophilus JCM 7366]|uniref:uncharacterized protein n=1 Tax=Sodiomyces alcalophilus JCM 7366 TaxID=591952 RepID=UPI0039B4A705